MAQEIKAIFQLVVNNNGYTETVPQFTTAIDQNAVGAVGGTFTATIITEALRNPDDNGMLYMRNVGDDSVFWSGDSGGSYPHAPETGELRPLEWAFFRVADGQVIYLTAASGSQPVQFLWLND